MKGNRNNSSLLWNGVTFNNPQDTPRVLPVNTFSFMFPQGLHTMKLEGSQMNGVLRPGVRRLADMFTTHGHELRVAGGAVRDLLLGKVMQLIH